MRELRLDHRRAIARRAKSRRWSHQAGDRDEFAVHAEHFAEMVRQVVLRALPGRCLYPRLAGLHDAFPRRIRNAAYAAVRTGVMDYDRRHGYRGAGGLCRARRRSRRRRSRRRAAGCKRQRRHLRRGGARCEPASGQGRIARAARRSRSAAMGSSSRSKCSATRRPPISASAAAPSSAFRKMTRAAGRSPSCRRSRRRSCRSTPADGAIRALVGGFDFARNKYNHVTQALRQPGSSFKPFIYSAALEKGFTPATIINDAPLVFDAAPDRLRAVGAEKLRRQVRRPDAHAHGAREIQEPRFGAHPAGDHAAVRAGLHHAIRLRRRSAIRLI